MIDCRVVSVSCLCIFHFVYGKYPHNLQCNPFVIPQLPPTRCMVSLKFDNGFIQGRCVLGMNVSSVAGEYKMEKEKKKKKTLTIFLIQIFFHMRSDMVEQKFSRINLLFHIQRYSYQVTDYELRNCLLLCIRTATDWLRNWVYDKSEEPYLNILKVFLVFFS